jgi:hypothetical protein
MQPGEQPILCALLLESCILQQSHWCGSHLRTLTALALVVVSLSGLPAVWDSHWMWIDDQIVVGDHNSGLQRAH